MPADLNYEDYALAIRALGPDRISPVVYDLNGEPIDIGSAEGNHIVLNGPGVEPYHLALRQVGSQLFALVDPSVAARHGESVWLEERSGDSYYCPDHARITRRRASGGCPLCNEQSGSLWLLRPLQAGDVFPVGLNFEASVLGQGLPNLAIENGDLPASSPWPDATWLEDPPREPAVLVGEEDAPLEERDYPFYDSNLWVWSPPESPFPVFMHQRVNLHVTRHASDNSNREVGGVLLGQVYRSSRDDVIYPVISHAISARFATEGRGHLTFTPETWLDIHRQCEEHYPGRKIVGWYHTHPGLDIFLSEWDLFIHRNFFSHAWQVALVLDPHQDAGGFFVWSDGDVLDPLQPHQPFSVADLEDGSPGGRRTRIRIKLGEPVV